MTLALSAAPDTTAGATMTPTGAALYAPDPLAPDFGVRMVVDAMSPAYEIDDTVLLRARRKGERITLGADYLFTAAWKGGERPSILARLTGRTATHWICLQHKGRKVRRLSLRKWSTLYVVTGKYCTANAALRDAPKRGQR